MAGTLSVQKIQGLASSATPTTVEIASGHKITGAAGSIVAPGNVIQVVQGTWTTQVATTSTSFVATGFHQAITPKFATSKILVHYSVAAHNNTSGGFIITEVYRNPSSSASAGTAISGGTALSGQNYGLAQSYSQTNAIVETQSNMIFDSPNTTSSTTYLIAFRCQNSSTSYFNVNQGTGTLTLTEIAQ